MSFYNFWLMCQNLDTQKRGKIYKLQLLFEFFFDFDDIFRDDSFNYIATWILRFK